ncbi:hypothetical protein HYV88_06305 [Candidatus Woesearchaeota archaeon]|nr:hypothetical protein [Candidatus Woesearchaeota archaeon]
MEIVIKPKKWGNSLGLIIPNEIIRKQGITSETNIVVNIRKANRVKDIFGILKDWKIDTQKARNEFRKFELEAERRKFSNFINSKEKKRGV